MPNAASDTHECPCSRLNRIAVDVTSGDSLGQVCSGVTDFLSDVGGGVI